MYRKIATSGITTRGQCFVDPLDAYQVGHFRWFFRSFLSFFFAFLTASIFIFWYFSSFFCFSSCLVWASHMYSIVSFPVRCQSGTFFVFFLFVTFCSFLGSLTKSRACTSIEKNTRNILEINNFFAKLSRGSPCGKRVTNKMSTATTSNDQNNSSSLQPHLLSGSSTPGWLASSSVSSIVDQSFSLLLWVWGVWHYSCCTVRTILLKESSSQGLQLGCLSCFVWV